MAAHRTATDAANLKVHTLQNELDAANNQMAQKEASSKKLLEDASAAAQAEKIRLQSDISSYAAKINSLEAELAGLIKQRDESNKEIATLQDDKTSLSMQMVQLQGVSFDCLVYVIDTG